MGKGESKMKIENFSPTFFPHFPFFIKKEWGRRLFPIQKKASVPIFSRH
jgi:hypothetical protein